ncbi:XRE family transcriptional regulator [Kineococcus sp. TRM81007]|uniref:helix-turn-helix domain-containing protein n=1 Tax=Kineococcus sp. TRM81007 TaxID=2925831 RepID=UPI001F571B4D|nr:XRE family transcriptional regulator [Kineococcus sp. TRM81007]MCI2239431.1 XRE family transcriptional regulator [Kineococcus sp. TRM81007]
MSAPDRAAAATTTAADTAAALDAVGPRLRRLRTARGLTLAQVSAATGTSASTLSRLESGGRRATLELLLPLVAHYEVSLDELVAPERPPRRRTARSRRGMTSYPLTRAPGGLRAYKLVLAPGCGEEVEPQHHEGYEWLYVMSGVLRLRLGAQDLRLPAGEAAEFDTHLPHAMSNPGRVPVELLSVFGPQGERMHVRARPRKG